MPAWTPEQISTTLWLDGSDSSTLYDATSGGSLVAANGAIARWEDKSGNGRHVTQATSGSRPTRRTSVRNSLDIVRFDGTDDLLETTFAAFGTSYAVVAVAMANNAASAGGGLLSCRSKTLANPINPQVSYNTGVSQFAVRNDAGTINSNNISGLSNSTWYLWGGVRDGNNVTTYRDGTAGTTGTNTIGTSITPSVTSVGGLYTGITTPNTFWNGDIAEIIVCSLSDREIVEGYLAWKWGLQTSLPVTHPYRYAQPETQWRYPSLRGAVAGYMAGRDTGSAASDQFTADGTQNGTLTNGATRVDDGGLAYSFDGVDDYISTSAVLTAAAPFTIAAWAKPDNLTAILAVAGATNPASTDGWSLRLRGDIAGDPWQFTAFGVGVNLNSSASGTVGWQHVAVTISGTTATIYVNGVASGTATMTVSATTAAMFVAARNQGGTPVIVFDGCLDDFLIYSRALTATEIGYLASARGAAYQQTGTRRRRSTMGAGIL